MRTLIFFFLFLFVPLFGSSILEINSYPRENRVDLMISFDKPYDGEISQIRDDGYLALTFSNLDAKESYEFNISQAGVSNIRAFNQRGDFYIIFETDAQISIDASKTSNGYGLRLRATQLERSNTQAPIGSPTPQDETPRLDEMLAQGEIDYSSYIIVMGVLLFLIIVLFVVKKKIQNRGLYLPSDNKKSWLFSKNSGAEPIKIVYQKSIDIKNRVVLIESNNRRYLILVGAENSIVLDKIDKKDIKSRTSKSDFEEILENSSELLEEYLNQDNNRLEDFKKKASQNY